MNGLFACQSLVLQVTAVTGVTSKATELSSLVINGLSALAFSEAVFAELGVREC